MSVITVIRENFVVKNFHRTQNDGNLLREFFFTKNSMTGIDMNKNIVTKNPNTKLLRMNLMRIMVFNFLCMR